jgi:hypothetical protein
VCGKPAEYVTFVKTEETGWKNLLLLLLHDVYNRPDLGLLTFERQEHVTKNRL